MGSPSRTPLTADIDALAALVGKQSEEGKCQGQPLLKAAAWLIALIPRTRRWRVAYSASQVMDTSLKLD